MTDTPNRMTIAVLGGSGKEGSGLALRWAHAGHSIVIGSRDAAKAQQAADAINDAVGRDAARGATNKDAAEAGELIVLAVPYSAQLATAEAVKEQAQGKVFVDVTVPLQPPKVATVQLPSGGSAVALAQKTLGKGVKVVSAFQNISSTHLGEIGHDIDCDVLVCSDSEEAGETVVALAREIGLGAFYAGKLANSAAAEALTSVLIALNKRYKVPGAGIRLTGLPRD